ncbi:hypothetical protein KIW84_062537 [Lathyrus oleraceus]|uniref:starch synthase n=1 Tax=Pisum sativum TaxID=3888 RepID=A0A9D5A5Q1_PEA|nr:hypothetical protein KIW84_062537 [Pisum sativum]
MKLYAIFVFFSIYNVGVFSSSKIWFPGIIGFQTAFGYEPEASVLQNIWEPLVVLVVMQLYSYERRQSKSSGSSNYDAPEIRPLPFTRCLLVRHTDKILYFALFYASKARTAEGGKGLHSTLSTHSKKFIGVLNGIDTDIWNPATDPFLEVHYNANDLQGKSENKEALRKNLGLSSTNVKRPLAGYITRLVPQKGLHLIKHAIYLTLELRGHFVLLGLSPVPHIQREFEGIGDHFKNHDHIRLILKWCFLWLMKPLTFI